VDRRSLLTVWLGWLWLMAGVNVGTVLYAVYAEKFGFSSLVLTLVFATYAVTLVLAVLLGGRLSDRLGRRPVLLAGMVVSAVALLVFANAGGVGWLFAARALQGVAVGLISGPATAALVEIDPRRDQRRPALLAGLAQVLGSGGGPLIGGCLVQWAPYPLELSFYVVLAATVVAAAFTLVLPEPGPSDNEEWRIQWPRVPPEIRAAFFRVGVTSGIVWAALALYLSVVPSYVADLLETSNLALIGANSAVPLIASGVTQVCAFRLTGRPTTFQGLGLGLLAAGLGVLTAASSVHSLALLLFGAVVTGIGHGLAFVHAQDELNKMAPVARRAEVTSAFICCIYVVVGSAVITVGVLDRWTSFAVAVGGVAVVMALGALVVAGWHIAAGNGVAADERG
jgi:MFS family permease